MSEQKTMVQTSIALGEAHYLLAQGHDPEELKQRIGAAIHSGGAFVDFVVVGNRTVSAFLDGRERIILTVETVLFDERDTGDVEAPFGGSYDIDVNRIVEGLDPI
ncbi:hypothetical protein [Microbacterium sp. NPDC058389]|uniref:hypothetical protein n=1 Tax=Microbacterium sp. NPDC058389 TaxID=3346475 RepID=UPI00364989E7